MAEEGEDIDYHSKSCEDATSREKCSNSVNKVDSAGKTSGYRLSIHKFASWLQQEASNVENQNFSARICDESLLSASITEKNLWKSSLLNYYSEYTFLGRTKFFDMYISDMEEYICLQGIHPISLLYEAHRAFSKRIEYEKPEIFNRDTCSFGIGLNYGLPSEDKNCCRKPPSSIAEVCEAAKKCFGPNYTYFWDSEDTKKIAREASCRPTDSGDSSIVGACSKSQLVYSDIYDVFPSSLRSRLGKSSNYLENTEEGKLYNWFSEGLLRIREWTGDLALEMFLVPPWNELCFSKKVSLDEEEKSQLFKFTDLTKTLKVSKPKIVLVAKDQSIFPFNDAQDITTDLDREYNNNSFSGSDHYTDDSIWKSSMSSLEMLVKNERIIESCKLSDRAFENNEKMTRKILWPSSCSASLFDNAYIAYDSLPPELKMVGKKMEIYKKEIDEFHESIELTDGNEDLESIKSSSADAAINSSKNIFEENLGDLEVKSEEEDSGEAFNTALNRGIPNLEKCLAELRWLRFTGNLEASKELGNYAETLQELENILDRLKEQLFCMRPLGVKSDLSRKLGWILDSLEEHLDHLKPNCPGSSIILTKLINFKFCLAIRLNDIEALMNCLNHVALKIQQSLGDSEASSPHFLPPMDAISEVELSSTLQHFIFGSPAQSLPTGFLLCDDRKRKCSPVETISLNCIPQIGASIFQVILESPQKFTKISFTEDEIDKVAIQLFAKPMSLKKSENTQNLSVEDDEKEVLSIWIFGKFMMIVSPYSPGRIFEFFLGNDVTNRLSGSLKTTLEFLIDFAKVPLSLTDDSTSTDPSILIVLNGSKVCETLIPKHLLHNFSENSLDLSERKLEDFNETSWKNYSRSSRFDCFLYTKIQTGGDTSIFFPNKPFWSSYLVAELKARFLISNIRLPLDFHAEYRNMEEKNAFIANKQEKISARSSFRREIIGLTDARMLLKITSSIYRIALRNDFLNWQGLVGSDRISSYRWSKASHCKALSSSLYFINTISQFESLVNFLKTIMSVLSDIKVMIACKRFRLGNWRDSCKLSVCGDFEKIPSSSGVGSGYLRSMEKRGSCEDVDEDGNEKNLMKKIYAEYAEMVQLFLHSASGLLAVVRFGTAGRFHRLAQLLGQNIVANVALIKDFLDCLLFYYEDFKLSGISSRQIKEDVAGAAYVVHFSVAKFFMQADPSFISTMLWSASTSQLISLIGVILEEKIFESSLILQVLRSLESNGYISIIFRRLFQELTPQHLPLIRLALLGKTWNKTRNNLDTLNSQEFQSSSSKFSEIPEDRAIEISRLRSLIAENVPHGGINEKNNPGNWQPGFKGLFWIVEMLYQRIVGKFWLKSMHEEAAVIALVAKKNRNLVILCGENMSKDKAYAKIKDGLCVWKGSKFPAASATIYSSKLASLIFSKAPDSLWKSNRALGEFVGYILRYLTKVNISYMRQYLKDDLQSFKSQHGIETVVNEQAPLQSSSKNGKKDAYLAQLLVLFMMHSPFSTNTHNAANGFEITSIGSLAAGDLKTNDSLLLFSSSHPAAITDSLQSPEEASNFEEGRIFLNADNCFSQLDDQPPIDYASIKNIIMMHNQKLLNHDNPFYVQPDNKHLLQGVEAKSQFSLYQAFLEQKDSVWCVRQLKLEELFEAFCELSATIPYLVCIGNRMLCFLQSVYTNLYTLSSSKADSLSNSSIYESLKKVHSFEVNTHWDSDSHTSILIEGGNFMLTSILEPLGLLMTHLNYLEKAKISNIVLLHKRRFFELILCCWPDLLKLTLRCILLVRQFNPVNAVSHGEPHPLVMFMIFMVPITAHLVQSLYDSESSYFFPSKLSVSPESIEISEILLNKCCALVLSKSHVMSLLAGALSRNLSIFLDAACGEDGDGVEESIDDLPYWACHYLLSSSSLADGDDSEAEKGGRAPPDSSCSLLDMKMGYTSDAQLLEELAALPCVVKNQLEGKLHRLHETSRLLLQSSAAGAEGSLIDSVNSPSYSPTHESHQGPSFDAEDSPNIFIIHLLSFRASAVKYFEKDSRLLSGMQLLQCEVGAALLHLLGFSAEEYVHNLWNASEASENFFFFFGGNGALKENAETAASEGGGKILLQKPNSMEDASHFKSQSLAEDASNVKSKSSFLKNKRLYEYALHQWQMKYVKEVSSKLVLQLFSRIQNVESEEKMRLMTAFRARCLWIVLLCSRGACANLDSLQEGEISLPSRRTSSLLNQSLLDSSKIVSSTSADFSDSFRLQRKAFSLSHHYSSRGSSILSRKEEFMRRNTLPSKLYGEVSRSRKLLGAVGKTSSNISDVLKNFFAFQSGLENNSAKKLVSSSSNIVSNSTITTAATPNFSRSSLARQAKKVSVSAAASKPSENTNYAPKLCSDSTCSVVIPSDSSWLAKSGVNKKVEKLEHSVEEVIFSLQRQGIDQIARFLIDGCDAYKLQNYLAFRQISELCKLLMLRSLKILTHAIFCSPKGGEKHSTTTTTTSGGGEFVSPSVSEEKPVNSVGAVSYSTHANDQPVNLLQTEKPSVERTDKLLASLQAEKPSLDAKDSTPKPSSLPASYGSALPAYPTKDLHYDSLDSAGGSFNDEKSLERSLKGAVDKAVLIGPESGFIDSNIVSERRRKPFSWAGCREYKFPSILWELLPMDTSTYYGLLNTRDSSSLVVHYCGWVFFRLLHTMTYKLVYQGQAHKQEKPGVHDKKKAINSNSKLYFLPYFKKIMGDCISIITNWHIICNGSLIASIIDGRVNDVGTTKEADLLWLESVLKLLTHHLCLRAPPFDDGRYVIQLLHQLMILSHPYSKSLSAIEGTFKFQGNALNGSEASIQNFNSHIYFSEALINNAIARSFLTNILVFCSEDSSLGFEDRQSAISQAWMTSFNLSLIGYVQLGYASIGSQEWIVCGKYFDPYNFRMPLQSLKNCEVGLVDVNLDEGKSLSKDPKIKIWNFRSSRISKICKPSFISSVELRITRTSPAIRLENDPGIKFDGSLSAKLLLGETVVANLIPTTSPATLSVKKKAAVPSTFTQNPLELVDSSDARLHSSSSSVSTNNKSSFNLYLHLSNYLTDCSVGTIRNACNLSEIDKSLVSTKLNDEQGQKTRWIDDLPTSTDLRYAYMSHTIWSFFLLGLEQTLNPNFPRNLDAKKGDFRLQRSKKTPGESTGLDNYFALKGQSYILCALRAFNDTSMMKKAQIMEMVTELILSIVFKLVDSVNEDRGLTYRGSTIPLDSRPKKSIDSADSRIDDETLYSPSVDVDEDMNCSFKFACTILRYLRAFVSTSAVLAEAVWKSMNKLELQSGCLERITRRRDLKYHINSILIACLRSLPDWDTKDMLKSLFEAGKFSFLRLGGTNLIECVFAIPPFPFSAIKEAADIFLIQNSSIFSKADVGQTLEDASKALNDVETPIKDEVSASSDRNMLGNFRSIYGSQSPSNLQVAGTYPEASAAPAALLGICAPSEMNLFSDSRSGAAVDSNPASTCIVGQSELLPIQNGCYPDATLNRNLRSLSPIGAITEANFHAALQRLRILPQSQFFIGSLPSDTFEPFIHGRYLQVTRCSGQGGLAHCKAPMTYPAFDVPPSQPRDTISFGILTQGRFGVTVAPAECVIHPVLDLFQRNDVVGFRTANCPPFWGPTENGEQTDIFAAHVLYEEGDILDVKFQVEEIGGRHCLRTELMVSGQSIGSLLEVYFDAEVQREPLNRMRLLFVFQDPMVIFYSSPLFMIEDNDSAFPLPKRTDSRLTDDVNDIEKLGTSNLCWKSYKSRYLEALKNYQAVLLSESTLGKALKDAVIDEFCGTISLAVSHIAGTRDAGTNYLASEEMINVASYGSRACLSGISRHTSLLSDGDSVCSSKEVRKQQASFLSNSQKSSVCGYMGGGISENAALQLNHFLNVLAVLFCDTTGEGEFSKLYFGILEGEKTQFNEMDKRYYLDLPWLIGTSDLKKCVTHSLSTAHCEQLFCSLVGFITCPVVSRELLAFAESGAVEISSESQATVRSYALIGGVKCLLGCCLLAKTFSNLSYNGRILFSSECVASLKKLFYFMQEYCFKSCSADFTSEDKVMSEFYNGLHMIGGVGNGQEFGNISNKSAGERSSRFCSENIDRAAVSKSPLNLVSQSVDVKSSVKKDQEEVNRSGYAKSEPHCFYGSEEATTSQAVESFSLEQVAILCGVPEWLVQGLRSRFEAPKIFTGRLIPVNKNSEVWSWNFWLLNCWNRSGEVIPNPPMQQCLSYDNWYSPNSRIFNFLGSWTIDSNYLATRLHESSARNLVKRDIMMAICNIVGLIPDEFINVLSSGIERSLSKSPIEESSFVCVNREDFGDDFYRPRPAALPVTLNFIRLFRFCVYFLGRDHNNTAQEYWNPYEQHIHDTGSNMPLKRLLHIKSLGQTCLFGWQIFFYRAVATIKDPSIRSRLIEIIQTELVFHLTGSILQVFLISSPASRVKDFCPLAPSVYVVHWLIDTFVRHPLCPGLLREALVTPLICSCFFATLLNCPNLPMNFGIDITRIVSRVMYQLLPPDRAGIASSYEAYSKAHGFSRDCRSRDSLSCFESYSNDVDDRILDADGGGTRGNALDPQKSSSLTSNDSDLSRSSVGVQWSLSPGFSTTDFFLESLKVQQIFWLRSLPQSLISMTQKRLFFFQGIMDCLKYCIHTIHEAIAVLRGFKPDEMDCYSPADLVYSKSKYRINCSLLLHFFASTAFCIMSADLDGKLDLSSFPDFEDLLNDHVFCISASRYIVRDLCDELVDCPISSTLLSNSYERGLKEKERGALDEAPLIESDVCADFPESGNNLRSTPSSDSRAEIGGGKALSERSSSPHALEVQAPRFGLPVVKGLPPSTRAPYFFNYNDYFNADAIFLRTFGLISERCVEERVEIHEDHISSVFGGSEGLLSLDFAPLSKEDGNVSACEASKAIECSSEEAQDSLIHPTVMIAADKDFRQIVYDCPLARNEASFAIKKAKFYEDAGEMNAKASLELRLSSCGSNITINHAADDGVYRNCEDSQVFVFDNLFTVGSLEYITFFIKLNKDDSLTLPGGERRAPDLSKIRLNFGFINAVGWKKTGDSGNICFRDYRMIMLDIVSKHLMIVHRSDYKEHISRKRVSVSSSEDSDDNTNFFLGVTFKISIEKSAIVWNFGHGKKFICPIVKYAENFFPVVSMQSKDMTQGYSILINAEINEKPPQTSFLSPLSHLYYKLSPHPAAGHLGWQIWDILLSSFLKTPVSMECLKVRNLGQMLIFNSSLALKPYVSSRNTSLRSSSGFSGYQEACAIKSMLRFPSSPFFMQDSLLRGGRRGSFVFVAINRMIRSGISSVLYDGSSHKCFHPIAKHKTLLPFKVHDKPNFMRVVKEEQDLLHAIRAKYRDVILRQDEDFSGGNHEEVIISEPQDGVVCEKPPLDGKVRCDEEGNKPASAKQQSEKEQKPPGNLTRKALRSYLEDFSPKLLPGDKYFNSYRLGTIDEAGMAISRFPLDGCKIIEHLSRDQVGIKIAADSPQSIVEVTGDESELGASSLFYFPTDAFGYSATSQVEAEASSGSANRGESTFLNPFWDDSSLLSSKPLDIKLLAEQNLEQEQRQPVKGSVCVENSCPFVRKAKNELSDLSFKVYSRPSTSGVLENMHPAKPFFAEIQVGYETGSYELKNGSEFEKPLAFGVIWEKFRFLWLSNGTFICPKYPFSSFPRCSPYEEFSRELQITDCVCGYSCGDRIGVQFLPEIPSLCFFKNSSIAFELNFDLFYTAAYVHERENLDTVTGLEAALDEAISFPPEECDFTMPNRDFEFSTKYLGYRSKPSSNGVLKNPWRCKEDGELSVLCGLQAVKQDSLGDVWHTSKHISSSDDELLLPSRNPVGACHVSSFPANHHSIGNPNKGSVSRILNSFSAVFLHHERGGGGIESRMRQSPDFDGRSVDSCQHTGDFVLKLPWNTSQEDSRPEDANLPENTPLTSVRQNLLELSDVDAFDVILDESQSIKLLDAIKEGCVTTVMEVMSKSQSSNVYLYDRMNEMVTPLMLASQYRNPALISLFLCYYNAVPNIVDKHRNTALHHLLNPRNKHATGASKRYLECARLLLGLGTDPRIINSDGHTALHALDYNLQNHSNILRLNSAFCLREELIKWEKLWNLYELKMLESSVSARKANVLFPPLSESKFYASRWAGLLANCEVLVGFNVDDAGSSSEYALIKRFEVDGIACGGEIPPPSEDELCVTASPHEMKKPSFNQIDGDNLEDDSILLRVPRASGSSNEPYRKVDPESVRSRLSSVSSSVDIKKPGLEQASPHEISASLGATTDLSSSHPLYSSFFSSSKSARLSSTGFTAREVHSSGACSIFQPHHSGADGLGMIKDKGLSLQVPGREDGNDRLNLGRKTLSTAFPEWESCLWRESSLTIGSSARHIANLKFLNQNRSSSVAYSILMIENSAIMPCVKTFYNALVNTCTYIPSSSSVIEETPVPFKFLLSEETTEDSAEKAHLKENGVVHFCYKILNQVLTLVTSKCSGIFARSWQSMDETAAYAIFLASILAQKTRFLTLDLFGRLLLLLEQCTTMFNLRWSLSPKKFLWRAQILRAIGAATTICIDDRYVWCPSNKLIEPPYEIFTKKLYENIESLNLTFFLKNLMLQKADSSTDSTAYANSREKQLEDAKFIGKETTRKSIFVNYMNPEHFTSFDNNLMATDNLSNSNSSMHNPSYGQLQPNCFVVPPMNTPLLLVSASGEAMPLTPSLESFADPKTAIGTDATQAPLRQFSVSNLLADDQIETTSHDKDKTVHYLMSNCMLEALSTAVSQKGNNVLKRYIDGNPVASSLLAQKAVFKVNPSALAIADNEGKFSLAKIPNFDATQPQYTAEFQGFAQSASQPPLQPSSSQSNSQKSPSYKGELTHHSSLSLSHDESSSVFAANALDDFLKRFKLLDKFENILTIAGIRTSNEASSSLECEPDSADTHTAAAYTRQEQPIASIRYSSDCVKLNVMGLSYDCVLPMEDWRNQLFTVEDSNRGRFDASGSSPPPHYVSSSNTPPLDEAPCSLSCSSIFYEPACKLRKHSTRRKIAVGVKIHPLDSIVSELSIRGFLQMDMAIKYISGLASDALLGERGSKLASKIGEMIWDIDAVDDKRIFWLHDDSAFNNSLFTNDRCSNLCVHFIEMKKKFLTLIGMYYDGMVDYYQHLSPAISSISSRYQKFSAILEYFDKLHIKFISQKQLNMEEIFNTFKYFEFHSSRRTTVAQQGLCNVMDDSFKLVQPHFMIKYRREVPLNTLQDLKNMIEDCSGKTTSFVDILRVCDEIYENNELSIAYPFYFLARSIFIHIFRQKCLLISKVNKASASTIPLVASLFNRNSGIFMEHEYMNGIPSQIFMNPKLNLDYWREYDDSFYSDGLEGGKSAVCANYQPQSRQRGSSNLEKERNHTLSWRRSGNSMQFHKKMVLCCGPSDLPVDLSVYTHLKKLISRTTRFNLWCKTLTVLSRATDSRLSIQVDRGLAASSRKLLDTLWGQSAMKILNFPVAGLRGRVGSKPFMVILKGEGATDLGGPFHEFISSISSEVMHPVKPNPVKDYNMPYPTFATPNAKNSSGNCRDTVLLFEHPSSAAEDALSDVDFDPKLRSALFFELRKIIQKFSCSSSSRASLRYFDSIFWCMHAFTTKMMKQETSESSSMVLFRDELEEIIRFFPSSLSESCQFYSLANLPINLLKCNAPPLVVSGKEFPVETPLTDAEIDMLKLQLLAGQADEDLVKRAQLMLLESLGRLIGMGICTASLPNIVLNPIIWNRIAGDPIGMQGLRLFDEMTEKMLTNIEGLKDPTIPLEQVNETLDDLRFQIADSLGNLVNLVEDGDNVRVTLENLSYFVALAKFTRLVESYDAMQALMNGIGSIIPLGRIKLLFDGRTLENIACGSSIIDLKRLQDHTLCSSIVMKERLFNVLGTFSNESLQNFIRFVSGRSRLPPTNTDWRFCVDGNTSFKPGDADARLPVATTCSFRLSLPQYSNDEILKERLLYAINNCVAIDLDACVIHDGMEFSND